MNLREQFIEEFGVWEEATAHLDLMVDREEMQLVLATLEGEPTSDEIAARLSCSPVEARARLDRAYRRHLVDREGQGDAARYRPAGFEPMLDYFAKQDECWDAIPMPDRLRIDERYFGIFVAKHRENVLRKLQGLPVEGRLPNDDILLLKEAEEMVEASEAVTVQPCDCRRLGQRCKRPADVCIALGDAARSLIERDGLPAMTREQGIETLRRADRKGLMHTGNSNWRDNGLYYICNCCSCDCYPFRAGRALDSKGVWPRNRYVAEHETGRCNACGACIKRCHFEAFERDPGETIEVMVRDKPKMRKRVKFDEEKCWGCGLCANTCPEDAITMKPLFTVLTFP